MKQIEGVKITRMWHKYDTKFGYSTRSVNLWLKKIRLRQEGKKHNPITKSTLIQKMTRYQRFCPLLYAYIMQINNYTVQFSINLDTNAFIFNPSEKFTNLPENEKKMTSRDPTNVR